MRNLTITLTPDWRGVMDSAAEKFGKAWNTGSYQGEQLNFESPAQFFGMLSERRWEIVRTMQGAGPMSIRELARRVERDVKRVHEDVGALLELGLIEKTADARIECPFAHIHVDFHMRVAA